MSKPKLNATALRSRISAAGLTQASFARLLSRNVRTVNRWARGHMAIPAYAWVVLDERIKRRSKH